MSVLDRIRKLSPEQQQALRALDREEQGAIALENLEAEHVAAEEAYLRRKDRLLGREVPELYAEIEGSKSALAQVVCRRQERFEALRIRVLNGELGPGPSQLSLLPQQA